MKAAQERIIQLKQEIKFIETEYIKSRAVIMKFEEERKQATESHKISQKLNNKQKNVMTE